MKVKPIYQESFFLIEGKWQSASGALLLDVLNKYEIELDERTQFARLYDYVRDICIYYRASAGKISITIWNIE